MPDPRPVVVLLPLAALGVIAVAARPAWLARYGVPVTGLAVVATIAIPLATSSGERLEARVGNPGAHAELGDTLIWFALAAFLRLFLRWRLGRVDPAVIVVAALSLGAAGWTCAWRESGRFLGYASGFASRGRRCDLVSPRGRFGRAHDVCARLFS